jgi:hypothetical protein
MITEMLEKKVLHFLKLSGTHQAMKTIQETPFWFVKYDVVDIPLEDRPAYEADLKEYGEAVFGDEIMNGVITLLAEKLCSQFSEAQIDELIKIHEIPTMQKYCEYVSTILASDMMKFMARSGAAAVKKLQSRKNDPLGLSGDPEDE